jgi:hypothetical protein
MKIKRAYIIIVAIGIIAGMVVFYNIRLYFQIEKIQNNHLIQFVQCDHEKQTAERIRENIDHYITIGLQSSNFYLDDSLRFVDIYNNTLSISDVFSQKKSYLVFRYSFNDCNSCVYTIYQYLWNIKSNNNDIDIIIMPYFQELREMIATNTNAFRNRFPSYLIGKTGLGLPVDKKELPYFFILDKDRKVQDVFVIDLIFEHLVKEYLDMAIRTIN